MTASSFVLFAALATASQFGATEADAKPEDPVRSREAAQRILALANQYEFFADAERRTRFELQSKPVLVYSNPVRGEVFGNIFVWTHRGRPEVIGAVFDYRTEQRVDSEFHLLSNRDTAAFRDGRLFLNPSRAGIEFLPVAESPRPADSSVARLRQMRDLAREFTVERDHPEQKREFMRLLPQPIYRYSSPEADITDGAIFVYVEGTDPEAYLLLEAAGREEPAWRFAFARMNLVEFWGHHKGQMIWHVAPVTWDTVFEKQEPYFIVRENPRRGLDRH